MAFTKRQGRKIFNKQSSSPKWRVARSGQFVARGSQLSIGQHIKSQRLIAMAQNIHKVHSSVVETNSDSFSLTILTKEELESSRTQAYKYLL